jgi:hypothetical protein
LGAQRRLTGPPGVAGRVWMLPDASLDLGMTQAPRETSPGWDVRVCLVNCS